MNDSEATPTFQCSVVRADAGAIVVATGEIDLASSPQLRAELQALIDGGVHDIVLDLERVTFIDSSGLGVLVGALKRVKEAGEGSFGIRGLNGPVRKVFEITGLYELFSLET